MVKSPSPSKSIKKSSVWMVKSSVWMILKSPRSSCSSTPTFSCQRPWLQFQGDSRGWCHTWRHVETRRDTSRHVATRRDTSRHVATRGVRRWTIWNNSWTIHGKSHEDMENLKLFFWGNPIIKFMEAPKVSSWKPVVIITSFRYVIYEWAIYAIAMLNVLSGNETW